jgi:choline dehydrogenase
MMRFAFALLVGSVAADGHCPMWCNSWTCDAFGDSCADCDVCESIAGGHHCADFCNAHTCSNSMCKRCAACADSAYTSNSGAGACPFWCNSWTCDAFGESCSSCAVCEHITDGEHCAAWCNAYTCYDKQCTACEACEGSNYIGCDKSYIVAGTGGGGAPMAYGLATAGCEVTVLEKGPDDNWTGEIFPGTPYPLWSAEVSWLAAYTAANREIGATLFTEPVWNQMAGPGVFEAIRGWSAGAGQVQCNFNADASECVTAEAWQTNGMYSEFMHYTHMTGGNTMHNLGLWVRGDCTIYEMMGEGWDCETQLEVFDEVEALYTAINAVDYGDLLNYKRSGYASEADDRALAAFVAAGYDLVRGRDVATKGHAFSVGYVDSSNSQTGVSWSPVPSRISTGKAFLDPVRNMKNFRLINYAWVEELIIEGGECKGVVYTDSRDYSAGRAKIQLRASRTVLAIGAVFTPQLLMLSGIGPADVLAEHGITPLSVLSEVGKNYQNHLWSPAMMCYPPEWSHAGRTGTTKDSYPVFPTGAAAALWPAKTMVSDYPATLPAIMAYASSDDAVANGLSADLGLVMLQNVDGGGIQTLIMGDTCTGIGLASMLTITGTMQAKSRGYIKLKTLSMRDFPFWQPGYYSDARDQPIHSQGFDALFSVLEPAGWTKMYPSVPACQGACTTQAQAQQQASYGNANTFWHDSSTTAVGTVLNSDLSVKGVPGLYVADTGIFPLQSNMPCTAAIQMAALRAAHMFTGDRRLRKSRKQRK